MSQSLQASDAPTATAAPLEGFAPSFQAVTDQARRMADASMRTWIDESRAFLSDMERDGRAAMEGLMTCKTPFEVMAVEQSWLMARAKSYVDAGVRLMAGAFVQPEEAAAEASEEAAFRLPE